MPAWWSPLSDGIQRLVGRGRDEAPTAPGRAAGPEADAAPPRPPQAWPWQPPVQRALDPTFRPRLRPDVFVAGLASHQDPSFRRDLVHEVRPSVGGLVDGLADLVPGPPRTLQRSAELTVRPVRPAVPVVPGVPAVQRSFASFATAGVTDGLTTVELEPPWSAEPGEPGDPVAPAASVEARPTAGEDLAVAGSPVRAETTTTVPAATPRDVRLQRREVGPPTEIAPTDAAARPQAPPTAEAAVLPVAPVAPVVSRATDERAAVTLASPHPGGWVLPVVATPPSPRPDPPELTAVRGLPVVTPLVQRRAEPVVPTPSTGPTGSSGSSWSDVSSPSTVAEPVPGEPAPARTSEDTPSATAPLSGFAQAIEQLADQTAVDAGPDRPDAVDPVVGPVVPRSVGPTPDRLPVDVQRDAALDAALDAAAAVPTSDPGPTVERAGVSSSSGGPALAVEPPVAPLVGTSVGPASPRERPVEAAVVQRAAAPGLADLPVVPVAGHDPGGTRGAWDGPRLPVAGASSSSAPVGSPASAYASRRPTTLEPPVVARTVALAGSRPAVPRNHLEPALGGVHASGAAVQPLRFEPVPVQASAQSSRALVAPLVAPVLAPALASGAAAPSLQRSAYELPAVSPRLVGPGPVPPDPAPSASTTSWATPSAPGPETGSWSSDVTPTYDPSLPAARPADRPVQRLAAPVTPTPTPTPTAPARPTTVRALPFDQMFGGGTDGGGPGSPTAAYEEPGWTTVDLPVVGEAPAAVQRAVDTEAVTTAPVATPDAAPAPAPEPAAAPAPTVPAAAAAAPAGPDLDEMARRLFDPLSARLKAELWLDRERAGLVADAHF